jgi:hypothetical protein
MRRFTSKNPARIDNIAGHFGDDVDHDTHCSTVHFDSR